MNYYNARSERMPDGSINYSISFNLKSENDIFKYDNNSELVVIKEQDGKRYYLHLGLFIVKIPYEYAHDRIKERPSDFWNFVECKILDYILNEYYDNNDDFEEYLKLHNFNINEIKRRLEKSIDFIDEFCNYYYDVVNFFDSWAVIETDQYYENIERILIRKRSKGHIETIKWE